MYAYIDSNTGIVWAVAKSDISLADYKIRYPSSLVDIRRDDAPIDSIGCASFKPVYSIWDGEEYTLIDDILELKFVKKEVIDQRTRELISSGVVYEGQRFGMSLGDQSTWHARYNLVHAGVATFPMVVWTFDNFPYSVADATAFDTMYFTGFASVKAILDSGRDLKTEVNACTTKTEIDAIVDARKNV